MARRKTGIVDARTVARIMAMAKAREPMSTHDIADQLNRWRIPTARGGRWHSSTVSGIIRRAPIVTVAEARELAEQLGYRIEKYRGEDKWLIRDPNTDIRVAHG